MGRKKELDASLLEWIAYFLDSGYSLFAVLELLIQLTNDKNLKKLQNLLKDGVNVRQAFLLLEVDPLFKEYFSLYSETNTISLAITKSLQLLNQKKDFLKEIKKKMTYPFVLLIFSFIFALFISIYLIPQLYILYASFDQSPNPMVLLYFNILAKIPLLFFFCLALLSIYLLRNINCIKKGNFDYVQRLKNNKRLNKYVRIYLSIKFALYYKETVRLTASTRQALYLLQKDNLQKDLKMLIYILNENIHDGDSLIEAIQKCSYFDPYFCQLFEMAIKTNQIEKTMELYVFTMTKMLHQKIEKLLKIIIPTIYIYSAGSVVSIYFLIIIPLMNLVDQF